jgi:hypothetical protein
MITVPRVRTCYPGVWGKSRRLEPRYVFFRLLAKESHGP